MLLLNIRAEFMFCPQKNKVSLEILSGSDSFSTMEVET